MGSDDEYAYDNSQTNNIDFILQSISCSIYELYETTKIILRDQGSTLFL